MTLRWRRWPAACLLLAITLAAWANSFASGFVLDNNYFILGDSRIRQATAENLALIVNHSYWWPYAESGLYRPITTLTYLFNYTILGNADHPAGYHWINLLLHAGNVLLVFALARRLVRDFRQSFLIAAVWAVHPVLTESVTNIVGRADLLAGMTSLGGLLIYLRSTEAAGLRRWGWLAGLGAATAVGVFSKESAVAVVGIVALYELTWWSLPQASSDGMTVKLRRFLWGCLAMAPALLAMWVMRSRALAGTPPVVFPYVDNPIAGAGFLVGRLTAIRVLARYLGLLVWPAHLSIDYSYAQIPLADGRLTDWIAWMLVAAVAIAVAFFYRLNKVVFFAAGFAFITLLPAANLVIPVGTILAERFLYLPAIGLSICLVTALYSLARRLRAGTAAPLALGLLITAALGARTWARNADWRDDITLWEAAVQSAPLSFKTHTGLAQVLSARGLGRDIDRALAEDERGLAILDTLPVRLDVSTFYIRAARRYLDKGDSLRRPDREGRLLAPPESTADYKRAKALLLRAESIMEAQRTQSQGTQSQGDTPTFRTDGEIFVGRMLSETNVRLSAADAPVTPPN